MRTYVGIICSLLTFFCVNKAIACEAHSSAGVHSDHVLLHLEFGNQRVIRQLNVAQSNALQIFPDNWNKEVGFNWGTLLRTPKMLQLLEDNKATLNAFVGKKTPDGFVGGLWDIVNQNISLAEKNLLIEKASKGFIDTLIAMGFPVKSMKMVPHKLFNPKAAANDFRAANTDHLVKGPVYILEDAESFKNRLEMNFAELMDRKPAFATAQEISFGSSDGVDFTKIHDEVLGKYPAYGFRTVERTHNNYSVASVTYFDKDIWSDVSQQHEQTCTNIANKMKCFGETIGKTIVSAFEHKDTKEVWYIVNIHGDYPKANKLDKPQVDPWDINAELLSSQPGLIIAGDFNLMKANEHFIKGNVSIKLLTPETVNPTWDAIFVSSQK